LPCSPTKFGHHSRPTVRSVPRLLRRNKSTINRLALEAPVTSCLRRPSSFDRDIVHVNHTGADECRVNNGRQELSSPGLLGASLKEPCGKTSTSKRSYSRIPRLSSLQHLRPTPAVIASTEALADEVRSTLWSVKPLPLRGASCVWQTSNCCPDSDWYS
jgi:hypothetical protein